MENNKLFNTKKSKLAIARIVLATMLVSSTSTYLVTSHFIGSEKEKVETSNTKKEKTETTKKIASEPWVDYDINKVVALPKKIKDIEVSVPSEVTDKDIKNYVNALCKQNPFYQRLDKKVVEKDSYVNIDYDGTIDGNSITNGGVTDTVVHFGEGTFEDDFEKSIVGKNVGDTAKVSITYPKDYKENEQLAGQTVEYTIKINKIVSETIYTYDTLTDAYVDRAFDCDDVQDFLSDLETELKSQLESYKTSQTQSAITKYLSDNSKVTVPDGLLEQKFTQWKEIFITQSCNGDENAYADALKNYYGTSDEAEIKKQIFTEEAISMELIFEAIASEQKIAASGKDWEAYEEQIKSNYNIEDISEFYKTYDTTIETGEDYFKHQYIIASAQNYIFENTNINYTKSEKSISEILLDTSSQNTQN